MPKFLDLSKKNLTEFPEIPDGTNLLHLYRNCISVIPEELPESIEQLHLEFNNITEIPSKLPKNLNSLLLGDNKIDTIHPLNHLDNLKQLILDMNRIESIPNLPKSLRSLSISVNPISEIQKGDLPDTLEKLFSNSNPQLIPYLGNLPENLKTLYIGDCGLTAVPKDLPKNLTNLSLGSNSIESITEEDCLPESLEQLCVWRQKLDEPLRLSNLNLPNLKALFTSEIRSRRNPPPIVENCFFSLKGGGHEKYKKHSLETMSRRFASRKTQHLERSANLIKSRFELWSLREEGARFRQNVREHKELFG